MMLAALALIAATTAGTTACSLYGGMVNKQLSTERNLANQRRVALQFVQDYPNPQIEAITFADEGHVDGSGAWGASAYVTVDGKRYEEILGTFLSGGDALPTIAPGAPPPHSVTVVYSDGSSEVLS
ncbi:hypothetical protein ACRAWC_25090 [Leifsonia sp. L25]|uniref:hypothetical protein n=1 Tax=Leifsonia TaxID=110932 RepID=UPI003D67B6A4